MNITVPPSLVDVHTPQSPTHPAQQTSQSITLEKKIKDKPKPTNEYLKNPVLPNPSKGSATVATVTSKQNAKTNNSKAKSGNSNCGLALNPKSRDGVVTSKTKGPSVGGGGIPSSHPPSCGCHNCFLDACKQIPNRDPAAYRACFNNFINHKKCPLKHPHNKQDLCLENLKKEKTCIMSQLNTFTASILNPTVDLQQPIPTVETPNFTPSYSSFTRIQENVASAVNVDNLKSLTS